MSRDIEDPYELGVYEELDDEDDDGPSNPSAEPPLEELIDLRLSRRAALTGLAATAAAGALGSTFRPGSGTRWPGPPRSASRSSPTT